MPRCKNSTCKQNVLHKRSVMSPTRTRKTFPGDACGNSVFVARAVTTECRRYQNHHHPTRTTAKTTMRTTTTTTAKMTLRSPKMWTRTTKPTTMKKMTQVSDNNDHTATNHMQPPAQPPSSPPPSISIISPASSLLWSVWAKKFWISFQLFVCGSLLNRSALSYLTDCSICFVRWLSNRVLRIVLAWSLSSGRCKVWLFIRRDLNHALSHYAPAILKKQIMLLLKSFASTVSKSISNMCLWNYVTHLFDTSGE